MPALLLIALLAAGPGAGQDDFASDFETATPGIAFGPVPEGRALLSGDIGWLRSALRTQIGIGHAFDLVLWADAFLLESGFGGQNGIHGGFRYTPVESGLFRVSLEATGGAIFVVQHVATANLFELRGELSAGLAYPVLGTLYGRVQMRGLSDPSAPDSRWGRDEELGIGVERTFGRFTVGAEGSAWARPGLDNLGQWRLRAGYRF